MGCQSETLLRDLGFLHHFWVSWKSGNSVMSSPVRRHGCYSISISKAPSTFQRGNQAKINPLHTASLLSIPKSSFSKVSGIFQNPRTPSTILATSLGFNYFGNFPQYMDGALGCFILGPFLGHTKVFLWQAVLPHELEKNIKKK